MAAVARDAAADEELVLITRGRKTGREHRVSLWFAQDGDLLWLRADERTRSDDDAGGWAPRRSGRGPDWYRNLLADPRCRVIIGDREHEARYEPSADAAADLRRLVELWRAKYGAEWVQDWYVEKGRVPVKLRLGQANEKALEDAYFEGYRRTPDATDADFAAIERAGIEDLKKAKSD